MSDAWFRTCANTTTRLVCLFRTLAAKTMRLYVIQRAGRNKTQLHQIYGSVDRYRIRVLFIFIVCAWICIWRWFSTCKQCFIELMWKHLANKNMSNHILVGLTVNSTCILSTLAWWCSIVHGSTWVLCTYIYCNSILTLGWDIIVSKWFFVLFITKLKQHWHITNQLKCLWSFKLR